MLEGGKFSVWICHALTLLTSPSLAEMLTILPDMLWPSVMSFFWDLAQPAQNPLALLSWTVCAACDQVLSHCCKLLLSNFFNYLSNWSSFSVNLIAWCSEQNSCVGKKTLTKLDLYVLAGAHKNFYFCPELYLSFVQLISVPRCDLEHLQTWR